MKLFLLILTRYSTKLVKISSSNELVYESFIFLFKVEDAVESLSREILTVQARGDKESAKLLLQKYGVMSEPLKLALQKLERIQVNVDKHHRF